MSQSLLFAFVLFATVMFITPGPNNVMLLSSGLTHGFRRTLPHIAGITIGMGFMIAAVGLGLGTIFITCPVPQTILKYAGATYPVYLAVAIAMSGTATVAWALFGSALRPALTSPSAVRAFNIVMALLLLASLYPVFMDA
jgi:threonine/homoserine/homoserine lactone efflux protein